MRGNFGLFRTFSPKLPRIHVDYIVMQMRKINREKGYLVWSNTGSPLFTDFPSNLANLIGWEFERNILRMLRKSGPATFSSPEPTILLACGWDRELWFGPKPEVRDSRTSRQI